MKQLLRFWTSVSAGDLVNVAPADEASDEGAPALRRAKVLALKPTGLHVRYGDDFSEEHVPFARIRARICLPWKPEDLRDVFIVLRRRNAKKEEYVEDLRVRRNFLRRILQLLTRVGNWRPGHGREPLQMYFTDFDIRDDHELEHIFEENAVPASLNFQDLDEADYVTELTPAVFQDWLAEGRHDCDVAQALLPAWAHDVQGSASET